MASQPPIGDQAAGFSQLSQVRVPLDEAAAGLPLADPG